MTMRHLGLIPLKAHSKTITGKDKRKMLGRPLFCWILTEAVLSKLDKVYVTTNDEWIVYFIAAHFSWTDKIQVISRSKSSEDGHLDDIALEFSENTNDTFDSLSILLATNPFTKAKDINHCLEAIVDGNSSATTVTTSQRHTWTAEGESLSSTSGFQMENRAVYTISKAALSSGKPLLSKDTATIEMNNISQVLLSSDTIWKNVEHALAVQLISSKKAQKIKYLVLDVDGVFTDGAVYYDSEGELAKRFDMRDGMGLEIMREQDIEVVIMTSEDSALVRKRMEKLKIQHLFLGAKDKYSLLEDFIAKQGCERSQIAYVGDDVNDLANLCSVGWSFAPRNATNSVLPYVDIVLSKDSGNGAIREASERLLIYNKRTF